MTNRVRLLRMVFVSMVIAVGLISAMPRLSGQVMPSVALVVDDTGSMTQEMPGVRLALTTKIADLAGAGQPFPTTVIVTFKDDWTTRLISNDPAQLQAVVDSLVAEGGDDCPESSIAALIFAANMLQAGGELNLWTDADSRPDGPTGAALDAITDQKSLARHFLVSDSCTAPFGGGGDRAGASSLIALRSSAIADQQGQGGAPRRALALAPLADGPVLGIESSVKTFSRLGSGTNSMFAAIPKSILNTVDGKTRYANLSANMMFTTVLPSVMLATPSAVPQNGAVAVELVGGRTNFQGSSTVVVGGTGVTVLSQSVVSPTRMLVNLAVSGSAAPGFRNITVTTNLGGGTIETARGVGTLQITPPPAAATVVGITPSQIAQGSATNVTITGAATHFANGTSVVSLGPGVTVNSVSVSSPTVLVANVTVGASAEVGFRDVSVTTGPEIAAEDVVGPLLIAAAPEVVPRILSATPSSGSRGRHRSVTVTGEHTHFAAATTAAFSGSGVTVDKVTVNGATSLTLAVTIASDAALGFRSIVVTTGSEIAALSSGFNIVVGTTHDLVADFGPPFGLWLRAGSSGDWSRFHPFSAKSIVTGDLDGNGVDEVIVDFGPRLGIWIRLNDSSWYQFSSATAIRMATGDLDGNGKAELLIDFPGTGIWVWGNNSEWFRLSPLNSTHLLTGDLDGNGKAEVIVDFRGLGIWAWVNGRSWSQLHAHDARSIVAGDFDGKGRDDVVVHIPGLGIWKLGLHGAAPFLSFEVTRLAAGDVDGNGQSDVIIDGGSPHGIWILFNGSRWSQLSTGTSRDILTSDLDNNGEAEVIVNFGGLGLWEYVNNAKWIKLHDLAPRTVVSGHLKVP